MSENKLEKEKFKYLDLHFLIFNNNNVIIIHLFGYKAYNNDYDKKNFNTNISYPLFDYKITLR